MNQLSSFAVITIGGGDRVSFTYDEINQETGEPISMNNKKSFYVVDETLQEHIDAIREYIKEHKLS